MKYLYTILYGQKHSIFYCYFKLLKEYIPTYYWKIYVNKKNFIQYMNNLYPKKMLLNLRLIWEDVIINYFLLNLYPVNLIKLWS